MEKTVIVGFAGGYCEARIMFNYKTEKWDVDFLEPASEDLSRPYEVNQRRGVTTFDSPREALLWIAEQELGWTEGAKAA